MSKELSNYNYCLDVVKLKQNIELAFLTLGERLMKIRDEKLYVGSWGSFEEYLDEIKISASVASRLITVYNKFVLEYEIQPELIANAGGWSNAYEIAKVSLTKEDAVKWLEESSDRLPRDTKIMLREAKTGVKIEDCNHEWIHIKYCPHCGSKERQYETD